MFFEARVADKKPIGPKRILLPKKSGNHQVGVVPTCELNKFGMERRYPPKLSYMMLSGSTPSESSICTTAFDMGPGPHM